MKWTAKISALICLAFASGLAGCVTTPPPLEEYTLARAALEAARSVEAAKYSPGYFHQAEELYRKAKVLYKEREYVDAKQVFLQSKTAAEKAENSARWLRHKSGEVL